MPRPPGAILREIRDDLGVSRTQFAARLPSRWSAEIVRNLEIGRTKVVHYHVEDLLDAGLLSIKEDRYQEIKEGIEERDERDIEGEVTEGERVQALSEMLLALDAKMDAMEQADRARKETPSPVEGRLAAIEQRLDQVVSGINELKEGDSWLFGFGLFMLVLCGANTAMLVSLIA